MQITLHIMVILLARYSKLKVMQTYPAVLCRLCCCDCCTYYFVHPIYIIETRINICIMQTSAFIIELTVE